MWTERLSDMVFETLQYSIRYSVNMAKDWTALEPLIMRVFWIPMLRKEVLIMKCFHVIMKQDFGPYFVIYMDLSLGFVTWICLNLNWLLAVMGVMHEADDAYSIRSTWSRYWLDQFLTLALNILILSIFYISMHLSTNYFAHFSGCWASFVCSCHFILECCVTFSGVKLSIRSFVLFLNLFSVRWR